MKQICILGFSDKRPIVYSITQFLQKLGTVLLVTDNRYYTASSPTLDYETSIEDVHIAYRKDYDEKEELGFWKKEDYDFIVYDFIDYVPKGPDVVIHVIDGNHNSYEYIDEMLDQIESEECRVKNILYKPPGFKFKLGKAISVNIEASHFLITKNIENTGIFSQYNYKDLLRASAAILSMVLDFKEDEIYERLVGDC